MKIYEANPDGSDLKCLTPGAKAYTAEGSYSADGKRIVFSAGTAGNVQLFIMNADGSGVRQLTNAPNCYNGGPFFSPDGTRVIFRADRKEKDRLQLYVINADGTGERAVTNNDKWVYWAPYWYKDGKHIIYTAADHTDPLARPNYDLYWMNIETGKPTRITHAPGQDVLPVFSPDSTKLMWTSSRDGRSPTQLYIADFTPPKDE
jgi:Tol biopolymer transport system component